MKPVKQLSLSEARAKLSALVDEVHKGKGPVAITQRSKVKAVLVDANWHERVGEELGFYRQVMRSKPLKLEGTAKLSGDLDRALEQLKQEREASFQRLIEQFK
ncbi:MAG: type II toxin-antitoxin system Phd/YefM family antitoxin [Deltaproteobacteria bacterium]|nr:type II toxin-antitoxin system Phd/YefM family antitoxin [Deltaproteobacteria bacterium]